MPTLTIKLPAWLASIAIVFAMAAGSLAMANPMPAYQAWEIAACMFFSGLGAGTFAVAPSVSSKVNVAAVAELPHAVATVQAAVDKVELAQINAVSVRPPPP